MKVNRMGPISKILAVILTILILLFLGGLILLEKERRQLNEEWRQGVILVLTEDIEAGTILDMSHVHPKQIPSKFLSDSLVMGHEIGDILGRPVLFNLKEGVFLLHIFFDSSSIPDIENEEDSAHRNDEDRFDDEKTDRNTEE